MIKTTDPDKILNFDLNQVKKENSPIGRYEGFWIGDGDAEGWACEATIDDGDFTKLQIPIADEVGTKSEFETWVTWT